MPQVIEELSEDDVARIHEHREWAWGHYIDPNAYESVSGKLRLVQTILQNGWIESYETWKLQSLGVVLGDALVQEVPELFWAVVEDEFGRVPALRWLDTSSVVLPLTAIAKALEDGVSIDVYEIFGGLQMALRSRGREVMYEGEAKR